MRACGEFDCEFDFDSHEWGCSHVRGLPGRLAQNLLKGQILIRGLWSLSVDSKS